MYQHTNCANVLTIQNIVQALYSVMNGDKGEKRNWDLYYSLFHPNAKSVRYEKDLNGFTRAQFLTPYDYVNSIGKWMESKRERGFYEKQINMIVEEYGVIAHVWSTSESYYSKNDSEPYVRNIHSFQLLYENHRWWIISLFWTRVTPDYKLPDKYLP